MLRICRNTLLTVACWSSIQVSAVDFSNLPAHDAGRKSALDANKTLVIFFQSAEGETFQNDSETDILLKDAIITTRPLSTPNGGEERLIDLYASGTKKSALVFLKPTSSTSASQVGVITDVSDLDANALNQKIRALFGLPAKWSWGDMSYSDAYLEAQKTGKPLVVIVSNKDKAEREFAPELVKAMNKGVVTYVSPETQVNSKESMASYLKLSDAEEGQSHIMIAPFEKNAKASKTPVTIKDIDAKKSDDLSAKINSATGASVATVSGESVGGEVGRLLQLMNNVRQARGLRPLIHDGWLANVSHINNCRGGGHVYFQVRGAGGQIWAGSGHPDSAFNMWRGSPGHWGQIMNGSWSRVGIALQGGHATATFE